ncbi:MAG: HAMP domain-containing histidine kinase, partial [Chloroflexota bacterium]|nr:HAMP domain-containing histidine kinase [Chloroflexota bacterium]
MSSTASLRASVRQHAFALATSLLAVVSMVAFTGAPSGLEDVYIPLGCALAVGLLLTVRLAPGKPGSALVLLPALAVDSRLGLSALPAVFVAAVLANLVRGVRGPRSVSAAAETTLAFASAHALAERIYLVPAWITFAVAFAGIRVLLWRLAERLGPASMHPRAERPELLLTLALSPVGLLPLVAGERLGDGALLLAVAALLALLLVVREAANLATLRAETEAERDRLARANALQDDLIHMITHELRNPLTLVMSYSQLTRRAALEGSTEAIPTYIGHVESAGKSIQRVMENLLQLSKLERSDSLPEAEPVQLASVVNQVVFELSPLAKQKEQTLSVEPLQHVEAVLAVPQLLRDALSNLISNAVKYTPSGGAITVSAERGKQSGTVVL